MTVLTFYAFSGSSFRPHQFENMQKLRAPASGTKKLALIVGDIREEADLGLSRMNFEVTRVLDEAGAMKYLAKKSPHVILLHFSEEMQRSIDAIKQIAAKDPTCCIFYITAYGRERVHANAMKAGAYRVGSDLQMSFFGIEFETASHSAYEESVRRKHARVQQMSVFVLMPFAKEFDEIYKAGISAPLRRIGFQCERVDPVHFAGDILDQILTKIQNAHFVVADMTGLNPNVFYEVGYAHALGKIVILLSQKTADIPFDLRRHRHIIYRGEVDLLRKELKKTSLEVKEQFERERTGAIKL
jgi:hypothetical protein